MVEVAKTFQQLATEFDAIIQNQGLIKAELLDNGRVTSTEITYLPGGTVVFEKHAPHLGFPPYFLVCPDGVFLDQGKKQPADVQANDPVHIILRSWDPRAIAEMLTDEEHYPQGGGGIEFDFERFPNLPARMAEMHGAGLKQAFYSVNNSRLSQLTIQDDGEALTLRFIYPDANPTQPVTAHVQS